MNLLLAVLLNTISCQYGAQSGVGGYGSSSGGYGGVSSGIQIPSGGYDGVSSGIQIPSGGYDGVSSGGYGPNPTGPITILPVNHGGSSFQSGTIVRNGRGGVSSTTTTTRTTRNGGNLIFVPKAYASGVTRTSQDIIGDFIDFLRRGYNNVNDYIESQYEIVLRNFFNYCSRVGLARDSISSVALENFLIQFTSFVNGHPNIIRHYNDACERYGSFFDRKAALYVKYIEQNPTTITQIKTLIQQWSVSSPSAHASFQAAIQTLSQSNPRFFGTIYKRFNECNGQGNVVIQPVY